ncbi:MAG: DNA polymerase III subunit delta [Bryobacterales bacterium]|nr:DNA polymerase III subunit delta [Bryobacterales bacterium]
MTPERFLQSLKRQGPAPAYLFLGAEPHQRGRCRRALMEAVLPEDERESGLTRYDLGESSIPAVIDDARSLSLFSARRLIIVSNAEAALPRQRGEESEEEAPAPAGMETLAAYMQDPSPGVVILFEATRFDFEGDDKKKLDRVRKLYAAVQETVELRRYSEQEARREAQALARAAGLRLEPSALEIMTEALSGDVARIAVEIEKLALYAGSRPVRSEDIVTLVPDARGATIFELVNAIGRGDRSRAMQVLDALCREGEYLPLALSFLSTQFRLALAARQAGLKSPSQVQTHFSRLGVPMWPSRAEQVFQTASRFSPRKMESALDAIFQTDRDLRGARPDDRIIMERFVLQLTA